MNGSSPPGLQKAFRAIVAAVAMAPFAWQIWFPLGGYPILMGAWVTFWALVGAFVTNVIAARLVASAKQAPAA